MRYVKTQVMAHVKPFIIVFNLRQSVANWSSTCSVVAAQSEVRMPQNASLAEWLTHLSIAFDLSSKYSGTLHDLVLMTVPRS
jgi:hypothetical protein